MGLRALKGEMQRVSLSATSAILYTHRQVLVLAALEVLGVWILPSTHVILSNSRYITLEDGYRPACVMIRCIQRNTMKLTLSRFLPLDPVVFGTAFATSIACSRSILALGAY